MLSNYINEVYRGEHFKHLDRNFSITIIPTDGNALEFIIRIWYLNK